MVVRKNHSQPVIVHKNDVLSGRGVYIAHHPGNQRFRTLIKTYSDDSFCASYSTEKRAVAKEIIRHIHELSPPGRFLKFSDGGIPTAYNWNWMVLSESEAIKKTRQALRDCNRHDRTGYAYNIEVPTDVEVKAKIISDAGLTIKQRASAAVYIESKSLQKRRYYNADRYVANKIKDMTDGDIHPDLASQPFSTAAIVAVDKATQDQSTLLPPTKFGNAASHAATTPVFTPSENKNSKSPIQTNDTESNNGYTATNGNTNRYYGNSVTPIVEGQFDDAEDDSDDFVMPSKAPSPSPPVIPKLKTTSVDACNDLKAKQSVSSPPLMGQQYHTNASKHNCLSSNTITNLSTATKTVASNLYSNSNKNLTFNNNNIMFPHAPKSNAFSERMDQLKQVPSNAITTKHSTLKENAPPLDKEFGSNLGLMKTESLATVLPMKHTETNIDQVIEQASSLLLLSSTVQKRGNNLEQSTTATNCQKSLVKQVGIMCHAHEPSKASIKQEQNEQNCHNNTEQKTSQNDAATFHQDGGYQKPQIVKKVNVANIIPYHSCINNKAC